VRCARVPFENAPGLDLGLAAGMLGKYGAVAAKEEMEKALAVAVDRRLGQFAEVIVRETEIEYRRERDHAVAVDLFERDTGPALIDTGASITCIAPTIVQALQLQPRGKRPVASATHVVPMNVYLVDLFLPFGAAGLVLDNQQVIEFAPAANSPFHALIGRDILARGVFTLSFDGHFTFSL
jgi:predicted aspartyl protease